MPARCIPVAAALLGLLSPVCEAEENPEFSHYQHITVEELECQDCHAEVEASTSVADDLFPDDVACIDCHDAGEVAVSRASILGDVRFSHKFHTQDMGLQCQHCHEGLELEDSQGKAPLPYMTTCAPCHDGSVAPPRLRAVSHDGAVAPQA